MKNPFQTPYYSGQQLIDLGFKRVGQNVHIAQNSTIVGLNNISLGSNIRIDSFVVILAAQGELEIGHNVHIEPHSSLVAHAGIEIGNYCTVSHGVRLFTASANYSGDFFTNVFPDPKYQKAKRGKILLGDHVILGGNSVVMPGVSIGEGSAIGALSFVRENVEPWGIYGGNPLRFIRERTKNIKELGLQIISE